MQVNIPRIMIAAIESGGGKTTLTCAILGALKNREAAPCACKCGPDFIDPMFHRKVLGSYSANLDLFLMDADACKALLAQRARKADIAVIEGVMGYYDGIGTDGKDSSYQIARETNTPVILAVTCGGISVTLAAILNGMVDFRPDSNIKGVILNGVSSGMYLFYKSVIEKNTGLAVLGYLPHMPDCVFESRHLGLITADEIGGLQTKIDKLAAQAERSIDLNAVIKIAESAKPLDYKPLDCGEMPLKTDIKIAVAKDRAFCFYYEENLELLETMGAKIVEFSPLSDKALPECNGIILGGGYPELCLKELSENTSMLDSIKKAISSNIPCLAECGGFMYLHNTIRGKDGRKFRMASVINADTYMTDHLHRFGYITLTANHDNLLCRAGESFGAHEFHFSDSEFCGNDFTAQKTIEEGEYACIVATPTLFAGYPHVHFWGNTGLAKNFIAECQKHKIK